ncbi:MAG: helix-hairpin-helix domain-containing protein [Planctomycetota bacterium]
MDKVEPFPESDGSPPGTGQDPAEWPARKRWLWSTQQFRAVAAISAVLLALYVVQRLARPTLLADPPPPVGELAPDLLDRLDPNVATLGELSALPDIGPAKAEAIVAFRESTDRVPAFGTASDLQDVRGIGPAIVAKLRPHLFFPDKAAVSGGQTTRSAGEP